MNPISLVIKREYLTRVKKKSFILFTILTPILIIALTTIPAYLMIHSETPETKIGVLNHNRELQHLFKSSKTIKYVNITAELKDAYLETPELKKEYDAILEVPKDIISSSQANLTSYKLLSFAISENIKSKLTAGVSQIKIKQLVDKYNIPGLEREFKETKTRVRLNEQIVSDNGEKKDSFSGIASGLGYILGFMIYMFIFVYGSMIMQGVMEEKKNRVVEVIITSVKPFHLLMGKIIGIIAVGLTQLMIWLILFGVTQLALKSSLSIEALQGDNDIITKIINGFDVLNIWYIGSLFVFYFLGGVLTYGSLMAAIGAAVDNPEDSQQFMMPLTIPLIISIILLTLVMQSPDNSVAVWGSIIPLSSPIIMTARIAFGVPVWQLITSMSLLIIFFIFCVWIAAKIYSTGILMYGKKINFKEIWKWIRYS
ncbi:ABC transporter permease [Halosquirtibacter xylanolyticus]|uniref:ABC transporter permease n=1 Tax=Halosquirtibacter xylanolyticus TaxID=3374599 RepID=UPI00374A747B|nr:ABC transporter permease [Prolixibacteraceae bacterium]